MNEMTKYINFVSKDKIHKFINDSNILQKL